MLVFGAKRAPGLGPSLGHGLRQLNHSVIQTEKEVRSALRRRGESDWSRSA
jgi:hypothetical protein